MSAFRRASLALVAAVVLLGDQTSKAIITSVCAGGRIYSLLGGLIRVDYAQNTGAAFSFFRGGGPLFSVVAAAVSAGIVLYYRTATHGPWLLRAGLGLILGGALGNLIDRVRLGYVVDFIDLGWWPVFNLADSAIVVGVALLALRSFIEAEKREP